MDLELLRTLFLDLFSDFCRRGYFQECFGYLCVDAGEVPGSLGTNIAAYVRRLLRKDDIWPIDQHWQSYTEDDLFDIMELLYDLVSFPLDGYHHTYAECGWHYSSFDHDKGQIEYRLAVNELLNDYSEGYELSASGEILLRGQPGLDQLLHTSLPALDAENVNVRVMAAVMKYRRYHSTLDERRDAIRDLADVLEYLRPKLTAVITKNDEGDLFRIANSFGIRHHNDQQKTNYDRAVWYSWMFYYYLATIHAVTRLIEKNEMAKE